MKLVDPWLVIMGLGAYHGLNPAMGWLFAVALGLQERSRRAVFAAIPPIALGHAISIGIVVGLLWLAREAMPERLVRCGAALILLSFGLYRLIRSRHPAWVGMRVGFRDLTLWSFLMATAHGAGLMLVPVLIGWGRTGDSTAHRHLHGLHLEHPSLIPAASSGGSVRWLLAAALHSLAYLLVAFIIALLVYEKAGLAILRRVWINLDLIWTFALLASAILVLFI